MLRILPDPTDVSNNDDHFSLQEVKKQLKVELVELGVDEDFLMQNFVIFDVKPYNSSELTKKEVIDQAVQLLENASVLLQSIQYLKLSNNIDEIVNTLSEEN